MTLPPPSDLESVLRLAAALVCAGVIGIERDRRHMPTGFRTLGLVGLGACAAVLAALQIGDSDGFSRVAQGVVTGIGFLGAGVIIQGQRLREVKGLTTAAAIWLAAAVGLLCGAGQFLLAVATSVLAVAVLLADVLSGEHLRKADEKPQSVEKQPKAP